MKIILRKRLLPSGKINLSLEYYKGTILQPNGKRKTVRDYENLKLFLHSEPKNADEIKENKEILNKAEKILKKREQQYFTEAFIVSNSENLKIQSDLVSELSLKIVNIKNLSQENESLNEKLNSNKEEIKILTESVLNSLLDLGVTSSKKLFKEITDILLKSI